MEIPFFWRQIDWIERCQIRTWRAKVIGGWVLRCESWSIEPGLSESMVFIPDPNHEWEIDKEEVVE
jgi:hypothetical protein